MCEMQEEYSCERDIQLLGQMLAQGVFLLRNLQNGAHFGNLQGVQQAAIL